MSIRDVRLSSSVSIPVPRTSDTASLVPTDTAPGVRAARSSWQEPWLSADGVRPSSEYWDVETASWRSRGPRPPVGD